MHLCFIDESGSPPKPCRVGNRPYFVTAGLIMHEAQWHGIADEVRRIKTKYGVTGEIKWRYFGPDNTDPGNSVAHLTRAKGAGGYIFHRPPQHLRVLLPCCIRSMNPKKILSRTQSALQANR
ncbi:MAG: DUF3800 domain-containing protein [Mesorhizobium sp.]|uniref:DUF3800 domain-containing protein n=1 Tax=Mesorhizobium sp. TaxID=1871066 RepID=UPI000BB0AEE4|nr:hypothetical protein CK222_02130 [Mesorhizobium sp. WSM3866]RUU97368.1 DUF3800 domain-containing protein [Mesorhizobium sp. M1A.F.Ca.IN.020.03.2.1]RUV86319.1 DUF3800 domain-containing protein [Mesorhizobium sp. M1A.F.Ca.IN.020.32.1.1]RUW09283.1 DUF3800 domain-containing protein [Mesorhizobium sp. M1A.F.Ca.IN.022.05.2.1]RUW30425.1 DUF3800 domain-containing protein [Mesorhizobium sp. M1A.F.Ca.IN.020.06.1.1]RWF77874.1 MAG: DUF3800 domain-containing protein [Mesorhizobium sp.]